MRYIENSPLFQADRIKTPLDEALVVGVPGFEPGRSAGALCSTGRRGQPYPPDTRTFLLTSLAESLGIEPSRA